MLKFAIRASSSAHLRNSTERGATLAELLVVLVIISVLAVAALPMAETGVRRHDESELRDTLRLVRTAIDRFHSDWRSEIFAEDADGVSENGYPQRLSVLVEGVRAAEEGEPAHRYLRRYPTNPFAAMDAPLSEHWRFIGYTQAPSIQEWNREDIYDLRPATDRKALDDTDISDW